MAQASFRVLFLCDANSARSVFGECLIRAHGGARFRGYSAGDQPRGSIHPLTLQVLREHGHAVEGLRSKSWSEFLGPDAPQMDFVFTVCRSSGCPSWPGSPITAQWETDDPAAFTGPEDQRIWAFRRAYREIESRVRIFTSLPLDSLDEMSLRRRVAEIGARAGTAQPAGAPRGPERSSPGRVGDGRATLEDR